MSGKADEQSAAPRGHVVGEGGQCWCGVTHALSTEFRLYYVCQHLANGKRCKNEIKKGDVFCSDHRAKRRREAPHGAVSERFMRHHYGASGFVKKGANMPTQSHEPTLGDAIPDLIAKVNALLEWMPQCSVGSSGYIRRKEVEQAIQQLEGAWGIARL